ncbi:MAG TPA: nuclear transport factor 2 family protein [Actinoplanes sp.]
MQEIREVIEARYDRLAAGDVPGMLAFYAPKVVEFNLAPPLGGWTDGRDPGQLSAWLTTFEAPPRRRTTRLEITASGDVAFATSIDSMTATPKGGDTPFTLWHRVTLGLSRVDGEWLIVHEHASVPFYMDGSFKAAIDLEP